MALEVGVSACVEEPGWAAPGWGDAFADKAFGLGGATGETSGEGGG